MTKGVWRRWFSHYIIFSCHFYLPHKNIWTLTSLIEGLLVENDAVVLERNIFINFVKVFSLFRNYFSLGKGIALHLNKFEFPSPMDALCKVWLKLVQWFLRRIFLKFVNVFLLFHNCLTLEKYRALHLNKLGPPSPKDALCQVWLKLTQWFWRRRTKALGWNQQVYRPKNWISLL